MSSVFYSLCFYDDDVLARAQLNDALEIINVGRVCFVQRMKEMCHLGTLWSINVEVCWVVANI